MTAALRGLQVSLIKALGRWENSAYQVYVRTYRSPGRHLYHAECPIVILLYHAMSCIMVISGSYAPNGTTCMSCYTQYHPSFDVHITP